MQDAGSLGQEELLGCLTDLESFVIRRSVCGESSRGYSEDFPAAVKAVGQSPREDLRAFWLRRGWPDDRTFFARLQDYALYRREPSKCRVMLEGLEESYGHKEQAALDKMTVEHVMPQSVGDDKHGKEWRAMLGPEWERVHETLLDTIGNLTLTGYNPSLSNKAFPWKQEKLEKSNLQMNKSIAKLRKWDAKAIAARGKDMAERLAAIWKRPAGVPYVPGGGNATTPSNAGADNDDLDEMSYADYWADFLRVLARLTPDLQPKAVTTKWWLPITLRFSRVVSDILRELRPGQTPDRKYKYYM